MSADQAADNTRAALLMIGSMAFFSVEDVFLKSAAMALPPGQVLALTGFAGGLIFWALASRRGEAVFSRVALQPMPLLRTVAEAVAAMLYIVALALSPLAMTSALLQASPLVVVAAAAVFLREKVGWRRWTSILVGFAGVLVILKPWDAGFDPTGLLTVACVIVLAVRDLCTRVMPAHMGTFQVSAWAYFGIVPAGVLLMALMGQGYVPPSPVQWAGLAGALLFGLFGYYAVVAAMRLGEVSVVAPFRYSRLVFAMIFAVLLLGEVPATSTLIGAAIVVGSGLYAFARERARKRLSLETERG